MLAALIVFVAQYVYVLLLGWQSLNVQANRRIHAACCSGMLGVLGFALIGQIAAAREAPLFAPVWWAYILAGPCGILTAMRLFHRAVKEPKK